MVLLIGLVVGLVIGLVAMKKAGLVWAWAWLLNMSVATYVGVYVTPTMAASASFIGGSVAGPALCALAMAIIVLVILNTICMTLLGDLKIEMPRVLDTLGAGLLGFANGMLVWGYVCLVLWISPLCGSAAMNEMCKPDEVQRMWNSSVGTSVAAVNIFSFQDSPQPLAKVVESLVMTRDAAKPKPKPVKPESEEEEVPESNAVPESSG